MIKKFINLMIVLLFILGLVIMFYPTISRMYYTIDSYNEIKKFNTEKNSLHLEEIEERMRLAQAYNSALTPRIIYDVFSDEEKKEGLFEYAKMLELRSKIGYISVPKININIPIYAGTSEYVLQRYIGHMEGTSLPIGGKNTHCVLTGHRGLPEAKLFSDLDKLEEGDVFYIGNIKEVIAYKVDNIKVVKPTDVDEVLIVDNKDYVTLLTCTPYMINSHRLLVRGHRIPYEKKELPIIELEKEQVSGIGMMIFMIILFFALVILLVLLLRIRNRRNIKNIKLRR